MSTESGFTLLELMITLVILSVVSTFALEKYTVHSHFQKMSELKLNVAAVQESLEYHIRESCNSGVTTVPGIPYLVSNGLLFNSQQATNPFTSLNLSYSINWGTPKTYTVVADMGSTTLAAQNLQASGATRVTGSTLVWVTAVASNAFDLESKEKFKTLFEPDCI